MLTNYLYVFFISMVPLIELRGAIPAGVLLGLPLWSVYVVAILGNMLPVPFIFFFARKVLEWGCRQAGDRQVFHLLSGEGASGRREAESHRWSWPALGAAALCGHSPAGHRRLDRHPGRQPVGYGFQVQRACLHGRRAAGRLHHGRAERCRCFGPGRRSGITHFLNPFTKEEPTLRKSRVGSSLLFLRIPSNNLPAMQYFFATRIAGVIQIKHSATPFP